MSESQVPAPCVVCGAVRHVEIHHVLFRSRGGGHEHENLVPLCREHHRKVTDEEWHLAVNHEGQVCITDVATGEIVCETPHRPIEMLPVHLDPLAEFLRSGEFRAYLRTVSFDVLREMERQASELQDAAFLAQCAIYAECKRRAVRGDRWYVEVAKAFGRKPSTVRAYAHVWETFFADGDQRAVHLAELPRTFLLVASQSEDPWEAAEMALVRKDEALAHGHEYTVRQFKVELGKAAYEPSIPDEITCPYCGQTFTREAS